MGNAIDAEDALSLAMLKAKAKLSDYHDVVSNLRAWLYQLTKNLCLDLQRQRRRRAMVCDNVEVLCQSGTDQSGLDSPVDYVLQEELGAFCRAAIAALPPKLNAVMVLRVQEDMSYDDIAERLDLSAANVRKRVSQARAILRRRLADYEQGFELKTLACA
jgi:RNA polymerase sigma-70 factor (ECF subfamily)